MPPPSRRRRTRPRKQPPETAAKSQTANPPPPWVAGSGPFRTRPQVSPLALPAEQTQELDPAVIGGTEPVRHPGIELGRLAGREAQVVLADDRAQGAVKHVQPLVALVRLKLRLAPRGP